MFKASDLLYSIGKMIKMHPGQEYCKHMGPYGLVTCFDDVLDHCHCCIAHFIEAARICTILWKPSL